MEKVLLFISIVTCFFFLSPNAFAQNNQIVTNGTATNTVTFPGSGCIYNWVNDNPGIGLQASGTGNIPAFNVVNTGTTPITATITATPAVGGMAYITNDYINTVSVIDLSNNTILKTIPVGNVPTTASVSPNTNSVYVANSYEGSISVISSITNTVTATVKVGSYPFAVYASPDGSRVYAANYNDGNISVINTATNTVINKWPAGKGPLFMTSTNDGSLLYVNNYDFNSNASATVTVINTTNGSIVATITVGAQPWGITKSADGKFVYVANSVSNTVSVISTANNTLVSTVPVGSYPRTIAVSPDGSLLYVRDGSTNTLQVIRVQDHAILAAVPMGGAGSAGVAISPDGTRVVAINQVNSVSTVVDTKSNAVLANISLPGNESLGMGNFIMGGNNCSSVTFTITVNPSPIIATGTVTGSISACAGTASASPDIQQFTVSGSNLTNDIIATAPTGFEVSLGPGNGYASSITLTQSNGKVSNTVVYIRMAASVLPGNISGNVVLTSTGAISQKETVTGSVSALPTVSAVPNQTVANGMGTIAVNFTGTANTFTWVNNTPGIGLATTGTGNVASFNAVNTGSSSVVATIIVTPINNIGCSGNAVTFAITVNPTVETFIVPNTFTPNGDGVNDTWNIKYLNVYPNCTVQIFNRYGENIFFSNGYPIPWDGRYKGTNLPDGTYYYIIKKTKTSKAVSGYVVVVR